MICVEKNYCNIKNIFSHQSFVCGAVRKPEKDHQYHTSPCLFLFYFVIIKARLKTV